MQSLKATGAKPQATGKQAIEAGASPEVLAELESWKKKCKMLQQSEVKHLEEIESLKA